MKTRLGFTLLLVFFISACRSGPEAPWVSPYGCDSTDGPTPSTFELCAGRSTPPNSFRWDFLDGTTRADNTAYYQLMKDVDVAGVSFADEAVVTGGIGDLMVVTPEGILIGLGRLRDRQFAISDGYFLKYPARSGDSYRVADYMSRMSGVRPVSASGSRPGGVADLTSAVSVETIRTLQGPVDVLVYSMAVETRNDPGAETRWYLSPQAGLIRVERGGEQDARAVLTRKGFESPDDPPPSTVTAPLPVSRRSSASNIMEMRSLSIRLTAIAANDTDAGMCPNELYFIVCTRPQTAGNGSSAWTCMTTRRNPVPIACGSGGEEFDAAPSSLDIAFDPAVPADSKVDIVVQAWEADPIGSDQWDLDPKGGNGDMSLNVTYDLATHSWSGDTSGAVFGPGDSPEAWRRAMIWFSVQSPVDAVAPTATSTPADIYVVQDPGLGGVGDIVFEPGPAPAPSFDAAQLVSLSDVSGDALRSREDSARIAPAPDDGTPSDSETPPPPVEEKKEPDPVRPPPEGLEVYDVTSSSVTLFLPTEASIHLMPEPTAAERLDMGSGSGMVTLKGLAPAADYFFDVDGTVLHARTLGGPRASLDSPIREVHGFAPDVLLIVVDNSRTLFSNGALQGNTGSTWQQGQWTVTRNDGSAIPVLKVHRHSIVAGQPDYQVGYGLQYNENLIDVDHYLFLVLGQPIGGRDLLRIQGPFNTDFHLPFSDRYLETPVIQLNQVGYSPRATERYAYISGWMGDGGALSLSNFPDAAEVLSASGVMATVPILSRASLDLDAGAPVHEIDLSSVPPAEGVSYRIRVPGVGVSWPTQVSETGVFKAFYTIARGLTFNRWGRVLDPSWTEWSPRPADHPTVFTANQANWTDFYAENTPRTGERPLVGGHHDAGDFDIRPTHTVVGMLLLRAFEQHPEFLRDGQLTIPESGNGIPDLLDEALWSLAGWEYLQEADGGVRLGVESWRHPWGFYYADQDPTPYWTYACEANHTARVAGLFAQAARLVKPYNGTKSAALRSRAIAAWNWAVAHGASDGPKFYGAGELYRLTGSPVYKAAYETMWAASAWGSAVLTASILPWFSSYTLAVQPAAMDYLLGYIDAPSPLPAIVTDVFASLSRRADEAVEAVRSNHAHRNGRGVNSAPDWGMGTAVGEYVIPAIQRLQLGGLAPESEQAYVNTISLSADYVLGANPHGMVWITGLGSRHPRQPLHLDTLAFLKDGKGLMPGIPVFGPVGNAPGVWYYDPPKAAFYPEFGLQPLGRRYADSRSFVTTSEFDVGVQARQVQLLTALLGAASMPPESWLPGKPDHRKPLP